MMWSWIFIGFTFISKLHGYSEGNFPEVCESMRPHHGRGGAESLPQTSEPPFMVSYQLSSNVGDPITVSLKSKNGFTFKGFMLEARNPSLNGDGPPLGKFIMLDSSQSRLLKCGNSQDSAVSNALNLRKTLVKVNWTADGDEQDIIFRATFSESYSKYWERVNVAVLRPTSTPEPETTIAAITTAAATTTGAATTTEATTAATTMSATATTAAITTAAATITGAATTAAITTAAATITGAATTAAITTAAATITGAATTGAATTTAATTTTQIPTTKDVITTAQSNKIPATHNTTNKTVNILLICMASPLVEMSMQIPTIIMAVHLTTSFCHNLHLTTSFCHDLCKKFRIVGSSLSVLFSLATFILSLIYNSGDIIIGLVSVVLAISSIEWIIAMLPLGPSHELNELFDCALWVCFVFHQVFINVFLYVSINILFEEWGETARVFWLLIVHTALTIVWNIVLCTKKRTLLQKKRVSVIDKAKYNQHHKGKKEHLSPKGVVVVLCSVTMMVLSTALPVLIFVDYF
ncbi:serine/threonine-rich protein adg2-like isoform X1 [Xiphophorus hellerii]|uniref:serine/threonine-rich protein adg2-like isoform X1 n=1 Tax=Xiphophorus hellerii TaxID=8084 RepID=UPI0013B3A3B1|nr:serine/threonine-rich protein adg2-like isoform X1 [Xiphophorus hellerii]